MSRSTTFKTTLFILCAACWLQVYSSKTWAAESVELGSQSDAMQFGKDKESEGLWLDAIEHYEAALKKWPNDKDFEYHLRVSKIQFGIQRRYDDGSFENDLLSKSRGDALNLYEEVYAQVQRNYVDRLSPTSFVAHGTESLYYALSNTKFVEQNLTNVNRERVRKVKNLLFEKYWNKPVRDQYSARTVINDVCNLVQKELGLAHGPVVMEFLFGGCNSLDDYSNFLTPDRLEDLYGNIEGEFVGLGIEMKAEIGKGMYLVDVLPGSPAEQGGMVPEEFITAIDGVDCRAMSTDEAARLLRGPPNSQVSLKLYNKLEDQSRTRTFVRKPVQVASITIAKIVDEDRGIGYIKMVGFQKSTARELDAALAKLNQQGMRSLIWDLRSNPGGLLTAAVEVLDRFIDRGVLVSTRGRSSDQNWTYSAHVSGTYHRLPLVILVDGNSASASEIVAGAMRDHKRGQIIGRQTYGKWSVQSIYPIRGGSTGLRITTARFYSPHGKTHSKVGVTPHIVVEETEDVITTLYRGAFDEKYAFDPDIKRGMKELGEQVSLRSR